MDQGRFYENPTGKASGLGVKIGYRGEGLGGVTWVELTR